MVEWTDRGEPHRTVQKDVSVTRNIGDGMD